MTQHDDRPRLRHMLDHPEDLPLLIVELEKVLTPQQAGHSVGRRGLLDVKSR